MVTAGLRSRWGASAGVAVLRGLSRGGWQPGDAARPGGLSVDGGNQEGG
jgi:hypothetical protein